MGEVTCTGLDAQNPLAFLAAVGVLRVAHYVAVAARHMPPRLRFEDRGQWLPMLETHLTQDELVDAITQDAEAQRNSLALGLAYDDEGALAVAGVKGVARDLKPSPSAARAFLRAASESSRRDAELVAGFFSELVQDHGGATKPTALHFTAGQQKFLGMAEDLRAGITDAAVREALFGPWLSKSTLPSFSWDSSVSRDHALRARDPSGEKRGSVPAANWLGLQALAFFPVNAVRGRLETTCFVGGWKDNDFIWPLWFAPIGVHSVVALLRTDPRKYSAEQRAALGIGCVLSARVLRSDQGGYGSFRPAEVKLPRD